MNIAITEIFHTKKEQCITIIFGETRLIILNGNKNKYTYI